MHCDAGFLTGTMVALLTPVCADGDIDRGSLRELVATVGAAGVTGVSPLGSTGEGPSLALAQRLAVVDVVVESAGALPVLPGVFRNAVADALDDLRAYADHGASAALVAPPHYFGLDAKEIGGFFEVLADQTPLPLILYDIPSFTKNTLSAPVLGKLAQHERIIGVKDSTRDLEHLLQAMDELASSGIDSGTFSVMTGTDTMLLESLRSGATGAIVASANVAPELAVGIYRSWSAGDIAGAREIERTLRRLVAACRVGGFPAGWKAAAAAMGRCGTELVFPRPALGLADREALFERLHALSLQLNLDDQLRPPRRHSLPGVPEIG